jgi:hypothetical protein
MLGFPHLDFEMWETTNLHAGCPTFGAFLFLRLGWGSKMMQIFWTGASCKIRLRLQKVSGHDFSRAERATELCRALQAAEKLDLEGGGGFNPRIKPIESMKALAPEERILPISTENLPFPQPV